MRLLILRWCNVMHTCAWHVRTASPELREEERSSAGDTDQRGSEKMRRLTLKVEGGVGGGGGSRQLLGGLVSLGHWSNLDPALLGGTVGWN